MENVYQIQFELRNIDLPKIVGMRATAELHHSTAYFVVKDFHYTGSDVRHKTSAVPEQEIKCIETPTGKKWVHKHSGHESPLSRAIGEGIDNALIQQSVEAPCH